MTQELKDKFYNWLSIWGVVIALLQFVTAIAVFDWFAGNISGEAFFWKFLGINALDLLIYAMSLLMTAFSVLRVLAKYSSWQGRVMFGAPAFIMNVVMIISWWTMQHGASTTMEIAFGFLLFTSVMNLVITILYFLHRMLF